MSQRSQPGSLHHNLPPEWLLKMAVTIMLVRHFRSHQHDNYQGHLLCTIILGQRFLLEPDIEALSPLILIVLLLGIGLLLPPPDGRHHSYFHSGNSFLRPLWLF